MQAHDLEIGAADHPRPHLARIAQADHREADDREVAKGADRPDPRLQVLDFGHREDGVVDADPLRALADVDQPILVPIDQRP
jgi:hypothetical protein